jgi:hypothetical protein
LRLKVVTLTDGARALAKHANRSSSKYWGTLEGSGEDLFEFGGLCSFSHCGLLDAQVCKKKFCMLSNVYNHYALRIEIFLQLYCIDQFLMPLYGKNYHSPRVFQIRIFCETF